MRCHQGNLRLRRQSQVQEMASVCSSHGGCLCQRASQIPPYGPAEQDRHYRSVDSSRSGVIVLHYDTATNQITIAYFNHWRTRLVATWTVDSGLASCVSAQTKPSGGSIASGFSVLTDGSLNWDQVVLGRLILNLDDPTRHYYPLVPIAFAPEDVIVSPFHDLRSILNQPRGSRFIDGLKNLFPEIDRNAINEIADQKLITYKLVDSESVSTAWSKRMRRDVG